MGRLLALLDRCGIDLVLDVGANEGQYARRLRREGFGGKIISFEPLNAAFATLQSRCDQDEAWSCHKLAVGAKDEQATINVSANSQSNSLLPVCDWTVETEPSVAYVGQETVAVRRLDGLVPELTEARRIFLKIDTQGFESRVIEGARSIVGRIAMLQLELAWQPGYEGQAALGEMVDRLRGLGFEPVLITPAWVDRAGVIREVDVVFIGAAARQGV
jgi:FkbM family methyltransferase